MVPAQARALSILYVEDDPMVRDTITNFLRNSGHKVTEAGDGQAAFELFRPGAFDVVLTDFSMPRLSGQALARLIKETAPDQLVVMLTGSPEGLTSSGGREEWIDLLLEKPITEGSLNLALATLLR